MSILERVTITGADDSIQPGELAALSAKYDFVEWGILVSASNEGGPRYPTRAWRKALANRREALNLSIHIQGRLLRQLLKGDAVELIMNMADLLVKAQRIQLNFHGGPIDCEPEGFCGVLHLACPRKQILFQHDGCEGGKLMQTVCETMREQIDFVAFYDTSHGAGVLPGKWPEAYWMSDDETYDYHGYAGGLGPENLAEQIPLIAKAKKNGRFWIDMETRVRTYEKFDLEKVERALEICAPFVGKDL